MTETVKRRREYDLFEEHLRRRGLKMTEPRRTILEAFLSLESHVSAEGLLAEARRRDPRIGQATIFRTIKLLAEAGLAREACEDSGGRQYEHAFLHAHHDHLICVSCGKIVEFSDEAIEAAQAAVYRSCGFEPIGHRLELRGTCPDCRQIPT
jgi:Fur family ferric uptake transcriptional regulator